MASGQAGRQYPGPLLSTLRVGMVGQNQSYEKHEENEKKKLLSAIKRSLI